MFFQTIPVRTLENQRFFLTQIREPVLILNFYSPTCGPCIEELPAIKLIYEQAREFGFSMYLAVEPSIERNVPFVPPEFENRPFDEESFLFLQKVLKEDQKKRNIPIPMIIMEPPFRIDVDQIITGTPETLIFTTNPLRLRYNFVGPITTEKEHQRIQQNSRFRFFLELLQNLNTNLKTSS